MSHLPYLARMIASVALLGTAVLKLGSGHDAAIATPVPLYYGSAITELVLAGLLWTRLSRASCILGGALFVLAALWAMMQTPSHCGCLGARWVLGWRAQATLSFAMASTLFLAGGIDTPATKPDRRRSTFESAQP